MEKQYDTAKRWVKYMLECAAEHNPLYIDRPQYHHVGDDGTLDAEWIFDTRMHYGEWCEPIPFKLPELPDNPKTGKWYRVYPKDCVDAEGEQTNAHFSKGKENKLIVFFCGGGFSINEYTAARPMKLFEGVDMNDMFYMVGLDMVSDAVPKGGIMQNKEPNLFADWSKLYITYNTGDFHVGNNDYPYTAKDGSKQILHHHGYKNY